MVKALGARPFQVGITAAALVAASPLIWRQAPSSSFLIYPLVLIAASWLIGMAVTKATRLEPGWPASTSDLLLYLTACGGFGFFAVWLSTLPLEIVGNLWRGNVLASNLLFACMSAAGGAWAAYAIRLLRKSRSMSLIAMVGGGAALLVVIMWSGVVYRLPEFSIAEYLGTSVIREQYVIYGLMEATYWRILLPVGFIGALAMRGSGRNG